MTLEDFYVEIEDVLRANPSWQEGQALYNTLYAQRPDLCEQIRGTNKDPFFAQSKDDDPRLTACKEFLKESW